ncbi:MAG: MmgE/PrpD family protein [Leucothrix sp.]
MNAAPITDALASYAISSSANIPNSACHIARLSALDWLAVSIAGRDEPVSQIVRGMIEAEGGTAQAGVFGTAQKYPARAAALANGTISHALDYDDTHFLHIGHPSVGIMPAALAVAQQTGSTIDEWLDAALMGMEASCRVGDWLGRAHYKIGFHQTATAGSIGSVVAAARLLKLTEEQTRYAIGLAATRTSGLKCQFGTMGKPYHAGMAAANGVEAVTLAASGFISRPDALECEQGLAWTHHAACHALAFDGLGDIYVFESVQHKLHACCHGTHAALEAIIEARDTHQITPESVEKILIHTQAPWLKVCDIPEPATGLEAKFSYRMTSAMVLQGYDTAAITTFEDALCKAPALIALRDKVTAVADDAMTETQSTVTFTLKGCKEITVFHDLAGSTPYEKRAQKVKAKAATLLGQDLMARIWAVIEGDTTDLDALAFVFNQSS